MGLYFNSAFKQRYEHCLFTLFMLHVCYISLCNLTSISTISPFLSLSLFPSLMFLYLTSFFASSCCNHFTSFSLWSKLVFLTQAIILGFLQEEIEQVKRRASFPFKDKPWEPNIFLLVYNHSPKLSHATISNYQQDLGHTDFLVMAKTDFRDFLTDLGQLETTGILPQGYWELLWGMYVPVRMGWTEPRHS